MGKNPENPPKPLAGVPEDEGNASLVHERSLAPAREQYKRVWPTGYHVRVLEGEKQAEEEAKRSVCALLKKKHTPGDERYERLENEPIRI